MQIITLSDWQKMLTCVRVTKQISLPLAFVPLSLKYTLMLLLNDIFCHYARGASGTHLEMVLENPLGLSTRNLCSPCIDGSVKDPILVFMNERQISV